MRDSKGSLTPVELVKPIDKLMDELVRKIIGYAEPLSAEIARFKQHTLDDIAAFDGLIAQEYDAAKGGEKGNKTLLSYDGLLKVQIQIQDRVEYGPELQAAKAIIDECLRGWSTEARPEIRAIVGDAFKVDKAGKINASALLRLTRLEIPDERWQEGMRAIRDAERPLAAKEYVRFFRRASTADDWIAVRLDLAQL
ncbi:MAG: sulfate transporter [Chelatococcus sp.]|nr:MAG: sulfate transporter [Chelatococcus sp.]